MTAENYLRDDVDHLTSLRQQIDQIDLSIHRLILERTEIVLRVRDQKSRDNPDGDLTIMRPARETEIMRNLLTRHQGPFPPASLLRIWREMIGALSQLQGPFRVASWGHTEGQGLWDLARAHFGVSVPISSLPTPQAVVRAVGDHSVEIGIVPIPSNDLDQDSWWPMLIHQDLKQIHVIAQLPFLTLEGQSPRAWIISRQNPEPSSDDGRNDESLMVITTHQQISRDRLTQLLATLNRPFRIMGPPVAGAAGTMRYLIAVDGFLDSQYPDLAVMMTAAESQIESFHVLGSYAKSIDLA